MFRNTGKIRLDVEHWRAVEHVNAADTQLRAVTSEQFHCGQADGVGTARRTSCEDPMRTAIVARWPGNQIEVRRLIEDPDNKHVREAFDVGKARRKFG